MKRLLLLFLFFIAMLKFDQASAVQLKIVYNGPPYPDQVDIIREGSSPEAQIPAGTITYNLDAAPDTLYKSYIIYSRWGAKEREFAVRFYYDMPKEIRVYIHNNPLIADINTLNQLADGWSVVAQMRRYFDARDIYYAIKTENAVKHAALKIWYDTARELVRTNKWIALDRKVIELAENHEGVHQSHFHDTLPEMKLLEWRDVYDIQLLYDRGDCSTSFRLNQHYLDLWRGLNESEKTEVRKLYPRVFEQLEQNRTTLPDLCRILKDPGSIAVIPTGDTVKK